MESLEPVARLLVGVLVGVLLLFVLLVAPWQSQPHHCAMYLPDCTPTTTTSVP